MLLLLMIHHKLRKFVILIVSLLYNCIDDTDVLCMLVVSFKGVYMRLLLYLFSRADSYGFVGYQNRVLWVFVPQKLKLFSEYVIKFQCQIKRPVKLFLLL